MHYQDAAKLCQLAEVTKDTRCLAVTSLVFYTTEITEMVKIAKHLSETHGNIAATRWLVATIEFAAYLEPIADKIFEKAGFPSDGETDKLARDREALLAKAKEALAALEAKEANARG